MDNDLGANDPYRLMESGEDGIQPDFSKGKGEAAKGALAAAENLASAAIAAKTGKAPTGGAKAAEGANGATAASGGLKIGGGKKAAEDGFKSSVGKAEANEEKANGLYKSGRSDQSKEDGEAKLSMPKGLKAASPFLILFLALGGIIFLLIGLPVLMIGAIDYNLQKVLGFTHTVGILEKVGAYVTREFISNGDVPDGYASDLANHGLVVGQVTPSGDFVRTNTYIANIENRNDLVAAASGFSYVSDEDGELAVLFNGKVIHADDFVAEVESDPVLYAAYSEAADISSKYYYGSDVEQVYKDMGISRGNFNDWEKTGNYEEDEKAYYEILNKILDNKAGLAVGGISDDLAEPTRSGVSPSGITINPDGTTWQKDITNDTAGTIISETTSKTKEYIIGWSEEDVRDQNGVITGKKWVPTYSSSTDENATRRASELLNTAVSSNEPYLAANAFIAIEEPIQRARVDGDGPVNEVMNTLTYGKAVTYQDVNSMDMKTSNLSILETENFRAVVSDSSYSKDEAENFGRDRVLKVTGQANNTVIKNTIVASNGKKNNASVVRNGAWRDSANLDVTKKAKESLSLAVEQKNSDVFQSVVGGNRIVEGGSFISNTINRKVVGAMPSDAATIAAYHKEVEEVMARKAAAERATLSPFDISSPNTFFGSIVHNIATATIRNYGSGASIFGAAAAAGDSVGTAIANLTGSATADGSNDEFTTMSGNNCATVQTIGVEGDLYCSSHNTLSTDYMHYTFDNWKSVPAIAGSLDADGKIKDDSEVMDFIKYGMDRGATVGVKSADVCEATHDHDNWFQKIANWFNNLAGAYNVCKNVDEDLATGLRYSFSTTGSNTPEQVQKNKQLAGFVQYDEVRSLLTGTHSIVAEARDRYYAAHPRDKSMAGIIASRSGMTKGEAEIALAYADYLNVIASYDASTRYAFSAPFFDSEKTLLLDYSDTLALNLYAWNLKETEYEDLRSRNFVV